MPSARPRRSALFLPGSNPRAIEKAASLDADVILFDLEDAVAPDEKPTARTLVRQAVGSRQYGSRELVIRVNGYDSSYHESDVASSIAAGPDAVLLAKAEDPARVRSLAERLEASAGTRDIRLWCMIETPLGVLRVEAIASAHPRVECLVVGTSDLTNDLRIRTVPSRLGLLTSLSLCVLAARAHDKTVLDGVHLDLADDAGFIAACRQGRELGFDGKTLVHPRQIAPCNDVFSPSEEELVRANAIVSAYASARAEGRGVTVLGGRLVEELHVREAERTIALFESIQARVNAPT